MSFRIRFSVCSIALIAGLAGTGSMHRTAAQDVYAPPQPPRPVGVAPAVGGELNFTVESPFRAQVPVVASPLQSSRTRMSPFQQKLRQVMNTLREAESDESKVAARDALRNLLDEYFSEDLEERRSELSRLVKRADDTEDLLKTRESSRDALIDLQMKSYSFAADGLSLFGNAETSQPTFSGQPAVSTSYAELGVAGRWPLNRVAASNVAAVPAEEKKDARREAMQAVNKHWQNLTGIDWEDQTEKKQQVIDELRKALGQYFDADLQHRREELKKVREGLETMKNGIEKRENAREEIIALQLEVSENEAMGLGFFSGSTTWTSPWRVRTTRSRHRVPVDVAQPGILSPVRENGSPAAPAAAPDNPLGRR